MPPRNSKASLLGSLLSFGVGSFWSWEFLELGVFGVGSFWSWEFWSWEFWSWEFWSWEFWSWEFWSWEFWSWELGVGSWELGVGLKTLWREVTRRSQEGYTDPRLHRGCKRSLLR